MSKMSADGSTQLFAQTKVTGPLGPGLGPESRFTGFSYGGAKINNFGQAAWTSSFTGASSAPADGSGIFIEGPGEPRHLVALQGVEDARGPGLGPGYSFDGFGEIAFGDGGDIAMTAQLNIPEDTVYRRSLFKIPYGGTPEPIGIARTDGPHGPGLGPGVYFSEFNVYPFFAEHLPHLNSAGDVLFGATLVGPAVNNFNNFGLWISRGDDLVLLARKGELFDVNPSDVVDLRTIWEIHLSSVGIQPGGADPFNDDGSVVFQLVFTDGSTGIFIALPVPEPTTIGLIALCCAVAVTRRLERQYVRMQG
jgi:hypothetical protein